ncbi:MAG TPA: M23 family metallopeptidase [Candidatus Eremiobacteraceae bacterium]|nr:M23 family metallopeptidase [Candidatus Eremiobacteraceae bacterium]
MPDAVFWLVLGCQFIALWLSRPYMTFRLVPWLVGGSFGVSLLLFLSLTVLQANALPVQITALAGCIALVVIPRLITVAARRRMADVENVLTLQLPFTGRWRVAAAGPDPLLNHHLVASDQQFACDFVSLDGSFGRPILAPADGAVIMTSDGMPDRAPSPNADDPSVAGRPFGNYVVIRVGDAYVILCHLKEGSISVRAGQQVGAGEQVAQCGNSGRSTGAHLHIHAQKTPEPAPFKAQGVPIAFRDGDAVRVVITGDVLTG